MRGQQLTLPIQSTLTLNDIALVNQHNQGHGNHDLRHTCAAWLVQDGVDIRVVSELLRHSSIQVTMRYAHLSSKNVRDAVERLSHFRPTSGESTSRSDAVRKHSAYPSLINQGLTGT